MTGRGRTSNTNGTQKQQRPIPACSRSDVKKRDLPNAETKGNSEENSQISRSRGAHAKSKTTCTPTKAESDTPGLPTPKLNGDVKQKLKRESGQTKRTPAGKDEIKKTISPASATVGIEPGVSPAQKPQEAFNPKSKFVKYSSRPSDDGPINRFKETSTKDYESPNKVLLSTLDRLKIKKTARSESSVVINEIVDGIIKHMKEKSEYFRCVEKIPTGSYYENVKILEPDEFDVMLALHVDRADLKKFDLEGAFYSAALKRTPRDNPLRCFLLEDNIISASKMMSDFRDHVKKAVKSFPGVEVERKKPGCPAVTLLIRQKGREISLDIVLSLKVHGSWPEATAGGLEIDSWLGRKEKQKFKLCPFYLVPKYAGRGTEEKDGISAKDVWRISFSHIEKAILKNHGKEKTCCEATGTKCCRKPCLKLLKQLLYLLKQRHPKELSKFFSYLCKTTLLHACAARVQDSDWAMERLSDCFQQLLQDFEGYLRQAHLSNFFIPAHNLLGSSFTKKNLEFLAKCIETERNNGFPIFTA
ncbi:hypothetical protein GJAV_G00238000 [Gymnothorax javanicus]|nr:hypothetical protein GJAV_G00238000 [Gymnothorax javanicus]